MYFQTIEVLFFLLLDRNNQFQIKHEDISVAI